MKRRLFSIAIGFLFCPSLLQAAITSGGVGGIYTIIDDPSNASNGFQFLDLTETKGLTLANALSVAQTFDPDFRFATLSEVSDLATAASGVSNVWYDGAYVGSDWSTDPSFSGLAGALGLTFTDATYGFLAEGENFRGTDDGLVVFYLNDHTGSTHSISMPNQFVGTFVVLEAAPVPEPSAVAIWSLLGLAGVGVGGWRRRRRRIEGN